MFTRRNDDELITAYLDGQMNDRARREFEARLSSEDILRQRVETTRLLVQSARITTTPNAPRNFTLPRTVQTQRQVASPPRMMWRLASGLAAAVFVIALGLDAGGTLRPAAPLITVTTVTEAPAQAAAAAQVESTSTAPPPNQAQASDSVEASPPALSAKRAISETPATEMAAMAALAPVTQTEELSQTMMMAALPEATIEVTPTLEPTPQTIVAPAHVENTQDATWVARIVAGLALVIALGAGVLGWLRR